ncbi:DNA sulfur modification protein DndD [Paenibacillus cymbidii]|uniref:DNA sulfur modification protein DndD n=1 Tax=Paenibacillus cymbidii TaxID=1639034 RepID=UPI001080DB93|nr:DNA sulfur modification protein DndD [Paenibacillus cymbidii]
MIITQIEINNFGPFMGRHVFNLQPEKDRPVVLIMGHNGAGKTTLLEAIQLGIYGPFSLGLKSMTPKYQSLVKQRQNRLARKENPEGQFDVKIVFRWKSGRITETIQLERQWRIDLIGKLNETVVIYREGKELHQAEIFEVEERIRSVIPPSMMQFFFFDGERIDYILRNADFSTVLQEGSMNMFGLDLIDKLREDLGNTFNKEELLKKMEAEEQMLRTIRQEIEQYEDRRSQLFALISDKEKEIEEKKQVRESLLNEFRVNGGLMAEERRKIELAIKEKEEIRLKTNEQIKTAIAERLPFQMLGNLLSRTLQTALHEQNNRAIKLAYSVIAEQKEQMIKEWVSKDTRTANSEELDSFLSFMVNHLAGKVDITHIHDLTMAELLRLQNLDIQSKKYTEKKFKSWFKIISVCTSEIQSLRKQLEKSLTESALKNTWDESEKYNEEISKDMTMLLSYQEEANKVIELLDQYKLQRERILQKVNDSQREESTFKLAERIQNLMIDFQTRSLRQQVTELSNEIKNQFAKLLQKRDYVKSLYIDPESFQLSMQGMGNIEILPELMSAGERQLFLLAIIQAFMIVSRRQMPLVLDTLLGRLDLKHREAIVKSFLANTKFQTIVLATDSEISDAEIQHLTHSLSKVYEISFSEETGITWVKRRGA